MLKRIATFVDPTVGRLDRRHGRWRGTIGFGQCGAIPLAIPGSRSGPDEQALALARTAHDQFKQARPAIEAELADHRLAYDASATHEPDLAPVYVTVTPLGGRLVLEFGYRVPWDEEHTLGARVSEGGLIELCGSVVGP